MSEIDRIWDQLQRSFEGNDAWRCPSLRDLLASVSATDASAHPVPGAPSVWEMLLHGVVEHTVYHAGQIEMLMAAAGIRPSASPMAAHETPPARV